MSSFWEVELADRLIGFTIMIVSNIGSQIIFRRLENYRRILAGSMFAVFLGPILGFIKVFTSQMYGWDHPSYLGIRQYFNLNNLGYGYMIAILVILFITVQYQRYIDRRKKRK